MATTTRTPSTFFVRILTTCWFVLLVGANAAHAGICTTALIEEPFVLPDGTERNAGRLSVCVENQFSAVQTLHEIKIDRMPIGMTLSRQSTSNVSDANEPALIFARGFEGKLRLLGYTTPTREGLRTYTLQPPRSRRSSTLVASLAEAPDIVLTAALMN